MKCRMRFQSLRNSVETCKSQIELDREDDGRWMAEALELPGVLAYGATRLEATSAVERLAAEVVADRVAHGELLSSSFNLSFQVLDE